MRTKKQVITDYLKNPHKVDVKLDSELVKDLMDNWAEEVLSFVILKAQSSDLETAVKLAKIKMYPAPKFN
jgi:hypothetical protein